MRAKAVKEGKAKASLGLEKKVSEWHRENCVKEVSDETILKGFYYSEEAKKAENVKPAAGRMRRLLAQVSSLSTDLPEGIYVRHGESRLDVLKVMIIGPAGTPYEHGLFEFDMFCDSEFPQKPPKMFFWTTGGGHAAFNPNLYPNGKSKGISFQHLMAGANLGYSLPLIIGNMEWAALGARALDYPAGISFDTRYDAPKMETARNV